MKKTMYFILSLALIGCSEDSNLDIHTQKSEQAEAQEVSPYTRSLSFSNATRSSDGISTTAYETHAFQETGYDNTFIAAGLAKCAYKGIESPQTRALGLGAGVYFVEVIGVNKTLKTYKAKDIINPTEASLDDKNMGLKTSGYYKNDPGWNTDEVMENGDGVFTGTTYLIHFKYDMSGRTIDQYYPCKPEKLVWKYTSITLQ